MPTEDRFISFNLDEVYQAVSIRCARDNIDLPPTGRLEKIERDAQNDQMIVLNMELNADNTVRHLKLPLQFFALALVYFCQGDSIPVPQAGIKTLNIQPDGIIMRIQLLRAVPDATAKTIV